LDRETILAQARDALSNLHQEPLLQIHPLAEVLLAGTPILGRGTALKRLLLEAMQQLRPPHTVSYDTPAWRRYRSLFQIYLEGATFEDIAHQQGISDRQARRDHHQALEGLSSLLWARYREIHAAEGNDEAPGDRVEDVGGGPSPDDELHRIGSLPAVDPINLDEALRAIVGVIGQLAERLGVAVDVSGVDLLPPVTMNPTALRHALLALISLLLEAGPGGGLRISGDVVPGGVALELCRRTDANSSLTGVGSDPRLALGGKLLELQGARLDLPVEGTGGIQLRLSLPSVELPTVLLVDDNPDVLRLFRRYLRATPYRLVQATGADEALAYAREIQPRLITLDLMMPFRDGWDLLQALKRDPRTRDVAVVVCSVVHERALALALGATHFLPKPVSREALLDVLRLHGLGPVDDLEVGAKAAHELPDG
jgi:CheY-like chemotaxis protein